MSDTEKHYGKLVQIEFGKNSPEQVAKFICKMNGYQLTESTWLETLLTVTNENDETKYYLVNGSLYELIEHKKIEDDAALIQKNADGTYTFYTEFYNGGTCLYEQIEYLIEETQEKNGRDTSLI